MAPAACSLTVELGSRDKAECGTVGREAAALHRFIVQWEAWRSEQGGGNYAGNCTFQVILYEAGGRYGAAGGQVMQDVFGNAIGTEYKQISPFEAQKRGIPKPETWKDLTKPVYKGQIVMPNPASSGTGFFDVSAWLTLWGDDNGKGGGWKYMDALHENIAQYTHSGSKPCNMAAAGEFVVGISFEYRANTNKAKGAPIDLVFPKEGLGWDLEAFAIHKGTKKLDAAKKLADWASSKDAMLLYGKNFAITAQPGVAAPLANVPKDYEARLVKMDFGWAAENRERILAEWIKRYDSKSEPKK